MVLRAVCRDYTGLGMGRLGVFRVYLSDFREKFLA